MDIDNELTEIEELLEQALEAKDSGNDDVVRSRVLEINRRLTLLTDGWAPTDEQKARAHAVTTSLLDSIFHARRGRRKAKR